MFRSPSTLPVTEKVSSEINVDQHILSLPDLLAKKEMNLDYFQSDKINLSAPIEEHAAWAFRHIYSVPYPDQPMQKIARMCHGMQHVSRVAIYLVVLANLYRRYGYAEALILTDNVIKILQIAALLHDSAREDDGEDKWDHESAALIYFYLRKCGVEISVAIQLAEAMANKDADKKYYVFTPGSHDDELVYTYTSLETEANIYQKLLSCSDCLDIIRARPAFKAKPYFKYYADIASHNKVAFEEMAQLIIEARTLIYSHGDRYGMLDEEKKYEFENENGYKLILEGILRDSPGNHILPQLYNDGKLIDISQLTAMVLIPPSNYTSEDGLTLENIRAASREGLLIARGVVCPSAICPKEITEEGKPSKKVSFAQMELLKSERRPGIDTTSSKNDRDKKHGSPNRSTFLMGFGSDPARAAGFMSIMGSPSLPMAHISTFYANDANTGWMKNKSPIPKLFDLSAKLKQHADLINKLKEGGSSYQLSGSKISFSHTEIIATITKFDAIYYSPNPNIGNLNCTASLASPKSSLSPYLQAVYLQKEYKTRYGIILPIFMYDSVRNHLDIVTREEPDEETLIEVWHNMCSEYINDMLNRFTDFSIARRTAFANQILNLDQLKTSAMYWMNSMGINHLVERGIALEILPADNNYHPNIVIKINEKIKTYLTMKLANADIAIVKLLELHGENSEEIIIDATPDSALLTILEVAIFDQNIELIKKILKNHKHLIEQVDAKKSPLLYSALNEKNSSTYILLQNGANPNVIFDNNRQKASFYLAATQKNQLGFFFHLLHGANPNLCVNYKSGALFTIAEEVSMNNAVDCLKLLIDAGADIKKTWIASKKALLSIIKDPVCRKNFSQLVYTSNSNDNIPGFSLLHFAVFLDQKEIIKCLLAAGLRDNLNCPITAIDIAHAMNYSNTIAILEKEELYDTYSCDLPLWCTAIKLLHNANLITMKVLKLIESTFMSDEKEEYAKAILILKDEGLLDENLVVNLLTLPYLLEAILNLKKYDALSSRAIDLVITSSGKIMMPFAITTLKKANILTDKLYLFLEMFKKYDYINDIAKAIVWLHQNNLWKRSNRQVLIEYMNTSKDRLGNIENPLTALCEKDLQSSRNFKAIIAAKNNNKSDVAKAIIELHVNGLLTKDTRRVIVNYTGNSCYNLAKGIIELYNYDILTNDNVELLTRLPQRDHAHRAYYHNNKIIYYLSINNLLSNDNKSLLVKFFEDCAYSNSLFEFYSLIKSLNKAEILDDTNFKLLASSTYRKKTMLQELIALKKYNIFTEENRLFVIENPTPLIAKVIKQMDRLNILSTKNKELLASGNITQSKLHYIYGILAFLRAQATPSNSIFRELLTTDISLDKIHSAMSTLIKHEVALTKGNTLLLIKSSTLIKQVLKNENTNWVNSFSSHNSREDSKPNVTI